MLYHCLTQDVCCGRLYNAARVLSFLFLLSLNFNNAKLEIACSPPCAEAQGSYKFKQTVLDRHHHPLFCSQIGEEIQLAIGLSTWGKRER